jgi:ring-1,2-phenylacetyl-CoA epoxidase subunit PaaA
VDGAAIKNQTMLAAGSYGPYSRAMVRICAEEAFHHKQGKEMVLFYARGSEKQRQMAQDAINRWWWPALMMMGPHDADSPNSEVLTRWGIKTKSNDTVRQEFINEHAPEILDAGLQVPDPDLHQDDKGNWVHGPINWDEFWQVVGGNGPMNKERLEARRKAHDEGAWVRSALETYAAKLQKATVAV